jgi:hypothetical protein
VLNLIGPDAVLTEVATALEADVLPMLDGADERRQCKSAIFLIRQIAEALPVLADADDLTDGATDVRRVLEHWIRATPPHGLGQFVDLDGTPAQELNSLVR